MFAIDKHVELGLRTSSLALEKYRTGFRNPDEHIGPLNPAPPYPGYRYRERLILSKPVTLQRHLGSEGGEVTVIWETNEPYQAVLEARPSAGPARVVGLTLRHRSPSVANNYAVFLLVRCSKTLIIIWPTFHWLIS